jgi:polar amino acid transport system substrate-binding protein
VTNDFIALFKDTSVCSVITVVELTKQYNIAAMSSPSEILPLAVLAALLYLVMSYPLSLLASRMERRLAR